MAEVYWVTGLAGAGKTTIGTLLYQFLRERQPTIMLDGDEMRRVTGNIFGYTPEGRREGAFMVGRLCDMLTRQGITVVCCTISMFHDVRAWNRENIENYREIYLKVKMETLFARDQKGLYSHKQENVMGVTAPFDEPRSPDLILENDGEKSPQEELRIIQNHFHLLDTDTDR